jgi:D-alanine-D-alanine ligase
MQKEPPGSEPICVVYNCDFLQGGSAADAHGAEAGQESAEVAAIIGESLERQGRQVEFVGLDDTISDFRPNGIVFNLVESLGGDPAREAEFPSWLEARKIPFTGNSSRALNLAHAKHHTRDVLSLAHVRVPKAAVFGDWEFDSVQLSRLEFPLFVKPALYDGSVGIDQGSIVNSTQELRARLLYLMDHVPGPYLVETYLAGREFNVAVGPRSLGRYAAVTEIDFSSFSSELAPIVTYACKWLPESPEASAFSRPVARKENTALFDEVTSQARAALRAIGANSYGRVDMRLGRDGKPYVIDVNPNPDIHPEAGFVVATKSMGLSLDELYMGIVEDATWATVTQDLEVHT